MNVIINLMWSSFHKVCIDQIITLYIIILYNFVNYTSIKMEKILNNFCFAGFLYYTLFFLFHFLLSLLPPFIFLVVNVLILF